MKVERVSWQGFSIPFRKPYVTSQGVFDTRYGLLLFLHGDNGSVGIGEASPVGAGSREEVEAIGAFLGEMAPQLLATEPLSATGIPLPPEWNAPPVLRFGIETALLDLRGKALVRNASQLLNGAAKSLPVNALIAAETPKEAAAEAKDAADAGFGSIKLKVGLESAEQDEALVSAVRQAVGTEIKVRIDANRKWGLPEAIAGLRRLEQYDIEYVEDPLRGNDSAALAELRRSVAIPLAVDEALGVADKMQRLAAVDSADVLVIKAGRLGGLNESLELMRLAEDRGKGLVVTSSLESGVGLAASVHLAATLTAHPFAHGLATASLLQSDLLSAASLPWRGSVMTPAGLGLGVSVDGSLLERYGIDVAGSITGKPPG